MAGPTHWMPMKQLPSAGAFRFATGSPYTPRANVDLNNDGESGPDRPTVNGVHLGRNSERQPDFWTFDMRLSKQFGLGPGEIAIFAECFNCTDRETRAISGNNQIFGTGPAPRPTFGVEDDFVRNPRTIQLGLRYDF